MKRFLAFVAAAQLTSVALAESTRIIGGKVVPDGAYEEVVRLEGGEIPTCSGTIVGPKTILTAAQCQSTNAKVTFKLKGQTYTAKIVQSPLWDTEDHDLAIGITTKTMDVKFAHIGGKANKNEEVTMVGYGCSKKGGGPIDGKKRYGNSVINRFFDNDYVTKPSGNSNAILCYGDQGGPNYITQGGKTYLVGVNSKGNMEDSSYSARTDLTKSINFLKNQATKLNIKICGVDPVDCTNNTPDPPACTLDANPNKITIGSKVKLSMNVTGQATTARINNQTIGNNGGSITIEPMSTGTFTANGFVSGPGGEGNCQATYVVENNNTPDKPTCTLTATPNWINLGDKVTLNLTSTGSPTSASINGNSISVPSGSVTITPVAKGTYTATGMVSNVAGSNTCTATYKVGTTLPPSTPDFGVVPTYCGLNTLKETSVGEVCMGLIKKSDKFRDSALTEAILVTYRNGVQEAFPILQRKATSSNKESVAIYANSFKKSGTHVVFQKLDATLTTKNEKGATIPVAIQGRSKAGQYYIVNSLKPKN